MRYVTPYPRCNVDFVANPYFCLHHPIYIVIIIVNAGFTWFQVPLDCGNYTHIWYKWALDNLTPFEGVNCIPSHYM